MTEFGTATVELSNPYLKIEVNEPHQHFSMTFNEAAAALQWVNEEISFWDQVRSRAITTFEQNGIGNIQWQGVVFEQLSDFQKAVSADRTAGSSTATPSAVTAKDALASHIAHGSVLVRGSTVGDRVLALETSQPLSFALAVASHVPNIAFLKVANRLGQDRHLSFKQVLDGYRARYPARLSEVEGQDGALAKRVDEVEKLLSRARDTDAAISQLAETLRQKVATEKAVEVWKERIVSHTVRRAISMRWIVIVFGLAGVMVITALAGLKQGSWLFELTGTPPDPWTHAILLGLPILAAVWIIRMLTVMYRVDLAGAEDAAERVAMVETLYALSAETKTAPNEAERMLVVNALFRPGPSRDHDPSLPNTLVEQAAKLLARDASRP